MDVWDILNKNLFFVKDAVARSEAKTSDKYDIYDPISGKTVLECREPDIGLFTKAARLIGGDHDEGSSFNLVATLPDSGQQALRVARGNASFTLGGPPVRVSDHRDQLICRIRRKYWTLGLKFSFYHEKTREVFLLHVKISLGHCNFLIGTKQVATLTRKWESDYRDIFKDMRFAYAISFSPDVPINNPVRQLILAFAIAQHRIIMVESDALFKSNKRFGIPK